MKLCATPGAGLLGWSIRRFWGPGPLSGEVTWYVCTPLASVLRYCAWSPEPPPELAVQVTATVVTFAEPTVPVPLPTAQVCPAGALATVTLYGDPVGTGVGNVNGPLAVRLRASPP